MILGRGPKENGAPDQALTDPYHRGRRTDWSTPLTGRGKPASSGYKRRMAQGGNFREAVA
jgi:hypothetical protein